MSSKSSLIILLCVFLTVASHAAEDRCHYSTYKWNTLQRKAVDHRAVDKLRSELAPIEIDGKTGCTVCEEDQIEINLPPLRPFKACKLMQQKIIRIISTLQQQKAALLDVVAYRVGMTRGNVDNVGNRTQFSNHSYGSALDINTEQNGLYENCFSMGPQCRLIKGGIWRAEQYGSLTAESAIVFLFKQNGFKWGGEIAGQQKDFMHFSPTGY
jgi:hypothetical protein